VSREEVAWSKADHAARGGHDQTGCGPGCDTAAAGAMPPLLHFSLDRLFRVALAAAPDAPRIPALRGGIAPALAVVGRPNGKRFVPGILSS